MRAEAAAAASIGGLEGDAPCQGLLGQCKDVVSVFCLDGGVLSMAWYDLSGSRERVKLLMDGLNELIVVPA